MKFQRLLALFFIMLLSVSAVSCDDDDDDDVEPSRSELLTASQWTGYAVFVNGADQTQPLQGLGMDIRTWKLKFNTNGTYTIEGDWLDPSPYSGTWEFANNEQAILFDKNDPDAETIMIKSLTNSELFLDMEIEDEDGSTMEGEVRFRR